MKTPKVSDVVGIINKIAPAHLAEPWDNSGVQIADLLCDVDRIMVALDATPAVVDAALADSCQLLVTHHPLIFKSLKSVSTANPHGALIHKVIKGGVSIISMHTNYDIADGGLNDVLAEKIGLSSCEPLRGTFTEELVKLVVYVPVTHLEIVRSSMLPLVAQAGNYRDCSFTVNGVGSFTPYGEASPFCGVVGELNLVSEARLEVLLEKRLQAKAVKTLLAAHPYEEPAFDFYPLLNGGRKSGLGRVGRLCDVTSLADYASFVKQRLNSGDVRVVGDLHKKISKVALCSGSGASLLHDAARAGADVLVTGDVKYHEARDAEDLGVALIDAGHFPTEIIMAESVAVQLRAGLAESGYINCHVVCSDVESNPFQIL